MNDTDVLLVADQAAWRAWLDANEASCDGVWLILAKKGRPSPTTLLYAQALDEALCSGWIDGQVKSIDADTYKQRFTPRRRHSMWSVRNTEHVARLIEEGRMRARGQAEVDRAKDDGRWDRAYLGPAAMEVPDDLSVALADSPKAAESFAGLTKQERYAILHRIVTARTPELRARAIGRVVDKLAQGNKP